MNAQSIELPHNVIDLLKEAGDELEVVLDELTEDLSLQVDDGNVDWYCTIVRDHAHEVLQWVEQIEDQLVHRVD